MKLKEINANKGNIEELNGTINSDGSEIEVGTFEV